MDPERAAGIALVAAGLSVFGAILRIRARRAAGRRAGDAPALPGSLAPVKALSSPGGEMAAVVLAGAPFEGRMDRIIETGMWWLFWLSPAPLCRIEVWVFEVPAALRGAPAAVDDLLALPPVAKRLIWRGPGRPRDAGEVEILWTGPGDLRAHYRGTDHIMADRRPQAGPSALPR